MLSQTDVAPASLWCYSPCYFWSPGTTNRTIAQIAKISACLNGSHHHLPLPFPYRWGTGITGRTCSKEGPPLRSEVEKQEQTTTSSFAAQGSYRDTKRETRVGRNVYPDPALSHGDTTASVKPCEERKCQQNTTSLVASKAAGPPCSSLPKPQPDKDAQRRQRQSASRRRSSHKWLTEVLQQEVLGKPCCRQHRQTLFQCLPAVHHQKGNTRGIAACSKVSGPGPVP